jgi:hypothetical protein
MTEANRGEESFPPVESPAEAGDPEFDHAFFDSPPAIHRIYADLSDEAEALDPRMARIHSPEARRRRAKFGRYVRIATGASAGLCLVAIGKAVLLSGAVATEDRPEPPAIVHAAAPTEALGESASAASGASAADGPSASTAPSAGGAVQPAPETLRGLILSP